MGVGVTATGLAIVTPLFHTNFLPDLIQVKVLVAVAEIFPAFGHGEPALTAPKAGSESEVPKNTRARAIEKIFLILKIVLNPKVFVRNTY